MILLVLSVVLSLVSLHHSALVENALSFQLFTYNNELKIVYSLLAKECPEYIRQRREVTDLRKLNLEIKASHLQHLKQQLVKCRQDKLVSTTRTTTASVTDPAPLCPSYDGDSVFYMQFISYNNPTNGKAPGVLCRTDGSPCSISLEICVGAIKSTNCEFYHQVTDVVGEKPKTGISDNFGNLTNPVKINLANRKWQELRVLITVLEGNPAGSSRGYHEFSYDLTDAQGSPPTLQTLHGKRVTDRTELVMMFTVPCPSPSTTLPTTPSTTLPTTPSTTLPTTPSTTLPTTPSTTLPTTSLPTTTTSPPVPAECLIATNLDQSWRLDHSGSAIKGGGPHSQDGYACDLWDMGWFRFSGAAGTHMLDTCPKEYSCGTYAPFWTDETPPQAVGVTANITAYYVVGDNCKWYTRPIQVMRCSLSTDHDLIYKYIGYVTDTCQAAFCGMN